MLVLGQVRAETARMQSAAVKVQARWRCFAMRRQYQKQQQAAVLLQAEVRRWQAVSSYQELKAAALTLQVCAIGQSTPRHLHQPLNVWLYLDFLL
jgi:myosin heavy subunit